MATTEIELQTIVDAGHDEDSAAQVRALCQHLDCAPDDLTETRYDCYGLTVYECGSKEYAIGNDDEAQEAATKAITDSLWAFNAGFILSECDLPSELEEAIQGYQESACESANEALEALIEKCCGLDKFADAAIRADGRGHFLSSYDGEENEETALDKDGESEMFCIYRTN